MRNKKKRFTIRTTKINHNSWARSLLYIFIYYDWCISNKIETIHIMWKLWKTKYYENYSGHAKHEMLNYKCVWIWKGRFLFSWILSFEDVNGVSNWHFYFIEFFLFQFISIVFNWLFTHSDHIFLVLLISCHHLHHISL